MTLLKKYNDLSKRRKALEKSKAKAWSEFQKLHADAKYLKALGMMLKIREIEEELTLLEKQLVRRVSLLSSVPTVRSQISQEEYEMMLSEFKEEMDRAGKNIRGTMAASARNLVSKASDLTTKILADAESKRKQYRADVKSGKRIPVKRIKKVANDVKQAAIATAINAGATKAEAKQIGNEVAAATTAALTQTTIDLSQFPEHVPVTDAQKAAADKKMEEDAKIAMDRIAENKKRASAKPAARKKKAAAEPGAKPAAKRAARGKKEQKQPILYDINITPINTAPKGDSADGLPLLSKYSINRPRIPGMMYPAVMDPRDLPQFELA